MVFHSTFVVTTLAGRPVTWNAQERGDRGIGLGEALWRHKWHILLGLAWGVSIFFLAPRFIWWMMPVIAGLLLSAPLTALTSRASVGRFLRRLGLLVTPEEVSPPPELKQLLQSCAESEHEGPPSWGGKREGGECELPALPVPAPLAMDPVAPEYLGIRNSLAGLARIAAAAWPRHGEPLSR